MTFMRELRAKFTDSAFRTTVGTILLAVAAAVGASFVQSGWRLPVVAACAVLGLAAVVGPQLRAWYDPAKNTDDDQPYSWTVTISIVVALVVLTCYRAGVRGGGSGNAIVTLLLIAAAAIVTGVLIGFLFGIPRVTSRSSGTDATNDEAPVNLQTNTNLEAISDWLTKIIVGVGLVEATEIVNRFDTLLTNLARTNLPKPLMGGAILFFLVAGFLNGYLWTRLILTRYFSVSERALREMPEYYEGLMNAYLYQPKPLGFRKVVRLFEQYTKRFGEPRHSRVWVYLAAAYGQQYAWIRTVENKPAYSADLQATVDGAKQAINSALASDSDALELLQSLTKEGYDADLAMIARERPDVRAALRQP